MPGADSYLHTVTPRDRAMRVDPAVFVGDDRIRRSRLVQEHLE